MLHRLISTREVSQRETPYDAAVLELAGEQRHKPHISIVEMVKLMTNKQSKKPPSKTVNREEEEKGKLKRSEPRGGRDSTEKATRDWEGTRLH